MRPFIILAFVLGAAGAAAQPLFPVRSEGEAPSRNFDARHYRIEVGFDEAAEEVIGKTTVTLVPYLPSLSTIELDAEDLAVSRVTLGRKTLTFSLEPRKLVINLDRAYTFTDTLRLTVEYTAHPRRGLYFIHTDSLTQGKPPQIWTQGEDMDNHFWFPCVDFPNDFVTSEVIATVDESYQALSNGRLVSVTADKKARTRTFHWSQDIPHASYLIALAAGPYVVLHDKAGKVPLEYWVYPNHLEDAKVSFSKTADMVRWFSSKIGYPYPWEKYAQVLIRDFIEGGMENASCTFLTDNGSVFDARERLDHSPNSLIAHELAHQWWGDAVTARDWRHLWLNESFASYFDPLWHEHDLGRDEFDYQMYRAQQEGINSDRRAGRKPIVSVGSYGTNLYPRGASVLHMLRFVLGDTLFWRSLNRYITVHQRTPVETNDLIRSIQDATGQNLTWFFDQWVYKAGYPVFDLSSRWSDSTHSLSLSIKQTQLMDSLTGTFRTPVEIEVTMPEGKTLSKVNLASADTTIVIPAASRPTAVVFDPANWLLKEVQWTKSSAEWEYLVGHAGNPVERIRALQAIAGLPGRVRSLPAVASAAHDDAFWAVRREALITLSKFDSLCSSDSARLLQVLIEASRDAKPSVRSLALTNLGKFRGPAVRDAVRAGLLDSSITTSSAAVRSLARVDSANAAPTLVARLTDPREYPAIAGAALSALASVDTAAAYAFALSHANRGTDGDIRWPALNLISRFGKEKREARGVLVKTIDEPRSWYRSWAIRKLGEVGTGEEIAKLSAVASNEKDPESKTAKESIDRIKKRVEESEKREK